MSPSPQLRGLADKLARLRPDWNNPERYFENRQEIERDLRRVAHHLENHRG